MNRWVVLGCVGTLLCVALVVGTVWSLLRQSWLEAAFCGAFAYMVGGSVLRDFERARTPRGD